MFAAAFNDYSLGRWNSAKIIFEDCIAMKHNDGPSLTLLNFMKNTNYKCPQNWAGYRELTEK